MESDASRMVKISKKINIECNEDDEVYLTRVLHRFIGVGGLKNEIRSYKRKIT